MKILFVSDICGRHASANGICSLQVANELKKLGHEIHILQEKLSRNDPIEEKVDGFIVHRIPSNLHLKLVLASTENEGTLKGKIFYVLFRLMGIRTLLLLPWFPMRNPFQCINFTRNAKKLHKKIGFDLTICCFNPLAALYVGEQLKKKYDVPFISYFVDTLTDNTERKYFLTKKFMDNQGFKYEKRFYESCDLILNLKCHEDNFKQQKYELFHNKMKITDIPHLKNRISDKTHKKSDCINLVYTGSVRVSCLPGMLEILSKIRGIKLHFYSPNCIDVPNKDFIIKHGQVSHLAAMEAQDTANILVSMGNQKSTFIPSKIFEYISTGKPILHFYHEEEDSCLPYYKKYKNCCLINLNDDPQKNAETIQKFTEYPISEITWSELQELFTMNRAEYTVELILKNLN